MQTTLIGALQGDMDTSARIAHAYLLNAHMHQVEKPGAGGWVGTSGVVHACEDVRV